MSDFSDIAESFRKAQGADYGELERRDFLGREQPDPRFRSGMVLAARIAQALTAAILLSAGYLAGKTLVLAAVQLGWWLP